WCRSDSAASAEAEVDVGALIVAAVEHYNADRLPQADELLRKVLKIDSRSVQGLATLAAVRVKQDRYADAIAPAKAALTSEANLPDTQHVLGVGLLNLGR